jgi:hypothetical protein
MGDIRAVTPVLLVMATFSRHPEALAWGRAQLEQRFGPVGLAGEPFVFDQTTYYHATMGTDLRKQLLAFAELVSPDCLPDLKRQTNSLEDELAGSGKYSEPRPLNLDPGYLCLGKLVLASTKDNAHRIYLRDGIFAEVTLRYHNGAFEPWPWTYADYRQPCVLEFLEWARDYYRQQLALRGA